MRLIGIWRITQPAFTCSMLTTETLENGVSIVNFKHVIAGWVASTFSLLPVLPYHEQIH